MGLDVLLMKVVNIQDVEDSHKVSKDFMLTEHPELEVFKDFSDVTVNNYFAIDAALSDLGYDSSDV